MARIHDRMPVILERDLLDEWLDPATPPADLAPMLLAAPEAALRMWPVSTAVNRVQIRRAGTPAADRAGPDPGTGWLRPQLDARADRRVTTGIHR